MEHKDKRAPFFAAAMLMVVLLAIYGVALQFFGARLGYVAAFGISLGLSSLIAVLAYISRLRGEPPKLRCLFLIILMVLSAITNIIGMISVE